MWTKVNKLMAASATMSINYVLLPQLVIIESYGTNKRGKGENKIC